MHTVKNDAPFQAWSAVVVLVTLLWAPCSYSQGINGRVPSPKKPPHPPPGPYQPPPPRNRYFGSQVRTKPPKHLPPPPPPPRGAGGATPHPPTRRPPPQPSPPRQVAIIIPPPPQSPTDKSEANLQLTPDEGALQAPKPPDTPAQPRSDQTQPRLGGKLPPLKLVPNLTPPIPPVQPRGKRRPRPPPPPPRFQAHHGPPHRGRPRSRHLSKQHPPHKRPHLGGGGHHRGPKPRHQHINRPPPFLKKPTLSPNSNNRSPQPPVKKNAPPPLPPGGEKNLTPSQPQQAVVDQLNQDIPLVNDRLNHNHHHQLLQDDTFKGSPSFESFEESEEEYSSSAEPPHTDFLEYDFLGDGHLHPELDYDEYEPVAPPTSSPTDQQDHPLQSPNLVPLLTPDFQPTLGVPHFSHTSSATTPAEVQPTRATNFSPSPTPAYPAAEQRFSNDLLQQPTFDIDDLHLTTSTVKSQPRDLPVTSNYNQEADLETDANGIIGNQDIRIVPRGLTGLTTSSCQFVMSFAGFLSFRSFQASHHITDSYKIF